MLTGKRHEKDSSQPDPVSVAIYARASREREGTREGMSINRQIELCREAIKSIPRAAVLEPFVDDGLSGRSASRLPQLRQLLRTIDEGKVDIVYAERFDRFGRNAGDLGRHLKVMQDRGVEVRCLKEGTMDPLLGGILAACAQDEFDRSRIRISDSRLAHMKSGRAMGMRSYGWDVDVNDKYVVDHYEAEVVRLIFDMYGSGEAGVSTICQALGILGHPSPSGADSWDHTTLLGKRKIIEGQIYRVGGILTNTKYIGIRKIGMTTAVDDGIQYEHVYNDPHEWAAVDHPAIVSKEAWNAVQRRLAELEDKLHPDGGIRPRADYLLGGKISCGICGSPMVACGGATVANRPWKRTARQQCSSSKGGRCTHNRTYDMADIQACILQALLDMSADLKLNTGFNTTAKSRADLKREIGRLHLDIKSVTCAAERRRLIESREEALHLLGQSERARSSDGRERTLADKADAVLRHFPRHLNAAPDDIRDDGEVVRAAIDQIVILPPDNLSQTFRFRMATGIGDTQGYAHCVVKEARRGGADMLLSALKEGMKLDVRAAKDMVIAKGMERKHGLRGLEFLRHHGLAVMEAGLYAWSGREPLVVAGCSFWIRIDYEPMVRSDDGSDGPTEVEKDSIDSDEDV